MRDIDAPFVRFLSCKQYKDCNRLTTTILIYSRGHVHVQAHASCRHLWVYVRLSVCVKKLQALSQMHVFSQFVYS